LRLDFFDCNAQVGRFGSPVKESFFTPRELLDKLAPMGIRRALVFHALAKDLHPAEGNPALLELVKGTALAPCWVAMPHHAGEMPQPAEFVAQMKASGVGAVRLFPSWHQYVLADWCAGQLLEEFEKSRVPVFIEIGQTNYDHIAWALKSHPQLRLTIMQTSYRCDRYLYPLMERYAHLSIETSGYVVSGGIEAVCSRFGASRLIFGTGSPHLEPGAPVSLVTYAQISDADKQLIAGGNLEKLLAWKLRTREAEDA